MQPASVHVPGSILNQVDVDFGSCRIHCSFPVASNLAKNGSPERSAELPGSWPSSRPYVDLAPSGPTRTRAGSGASAPVSVSVCHTSASPAVYLLRTRAFSEVDGSVVVETVSRL